MDTEADRAGRAAVGQKLAHLREAAGYVQSTFAELVSYSRLTIANVETGRQRMPRSFWILCDSVLGTEVDLVETYDRMMTAAASRQRDLVRAAENGPPLVVHRSPTAIAWCVHCESGSGGVLVEAATIASRTSMS
jgi:DNA-binding XRE family transcriptional regulator